MLKEHYGVYNIILDFYIIYLFYYFEVSETYIKF